MAFLARMIQAPENNTNTDATEYFDIHLNVEIKKAREAA
jgi:hypothetical protein